jgi:hypothetical protein
MTFSYDFIPATNKEGKSLGTFIDYEVKDGESPLKDRKTGEIVEDENGNQVMRPWSFVSLLFEVKGRVAGTTKTIKLTTNGKFGSGADLEEALKLMGWVNELVSVELDEDGLEVEKMGDVEVDEDGLEVIPEDLTALTRESFEKFVETVKGSKFWMTITRDAKGFYRIEPNSLSPKV